MVYSKGKRSGETRPRKVGTMSEKQEVKAAPRSGPVLKMRPLYAKAGDVFFTHSSSLLGVAIRWAETDPGETNGTWANHAGVVVEEGWIAPPSAPDLPPGYAEAVVIEALWKTRQGPLNVSNVAVRVFRPIPPLTDEELDRLITRAASFVGDTYGWWKLLFQLGDRLIFQGKKVLTTALHHDERPICSYLVAKAYAYAESQERQMARFKKTNDVSRIYAFGFAPQTADPDEMMDYCLAHPDEWEEILQLPSEEGK